VWAWNAPALIAPARLDEQHSECAPERSPVFSSSLVATLSSILAQPESRSGRLEAVADWHHLLFLAHRWCVSPVLWIRVRNTPAASRIPKPVLERLQHDYHQNFRRNHALREQLLALARRLRSQGLSPIVLKGGIHLLAPPSGNPGLRVMGDVDLLLPPEEALACEGHLKAWGWEVTPHGETRDEDHHLSRRQLPGQELLIEIHTRPFFDASERLTADFVRDCCSLAPACEGLRIPSIPHRILHNALHAFSDFVMAHRAIQFMTFPDKVVPFVDLRQLLDYTDLIRIGGDGIDWGRVVVDADSVGGLRRLQQWGFLANHLMDTRIPPLAARPCRIPSELCTPKALPRHLIRLGLEAVGLWEAIDRWRRK